MTGVTERVWSAAAVAGVLLALAAGMTGCGKASEAPPSASRTYEHPRWGYSVEVPPGWERAERSLTPTLTDPVEILVMATYPLERGDVDCGPVALSGFDEDEVLVTILERGRDPASDWPDFPPRPPHFQFEPGMSSEFTGCLRETRGIDLRDHWFRFTDGGRHFHVLVAIGEAAPPAAEREAYRSLDSLRFDPSVKPDWRSAG
jgi:hypothetical protein